MLTEKEPREQRAVLFSKKSRVVHDSPVSLLRLRTVTHSETHLSSTLSFPVFPRSQSAESEKKKKKKKKKIRRERVAWPWWQCRGVAWR